MEAGLPVDLNDVSRVTESGKEPRRDDHERDPRPLRSASVRTMSGIEM
jgi:hypothetical protein